ncbi:non-reducing end alpha-L-arabinofuranosidase family hydrolase [Cellulomonas sp. SLBN-39]|uniref:non-reducing end alpha-L-arabinofuranosidase family hydrolase n=1 Tax=Cellulomonas sp. SLBN-39 TaxID=2768446 RepID=UPI001150AD8B|nr:non-reducing end alpha-L-arabinofuranosidase family hydrolase [Cellulomonas sp. SLBN-39]TQL02403.1 ricin-type beta-trefoil lectin protein [Cellulomonas sp. SLBN-39]
MSSAGSRSRPPRFHAGRVSRRFVAAVAVTTVAVVGAVGLVRAQDASAATVDTSASYVLVNRGSGKALDVYNMATNDGAKIVQWSRNDGTQQQWQFVDSGGGYYRLKSRLSGKVLDVLNFSTANGAAITQYTDRNQTNQQFRLVDTSNGYVTLQNRNSGKALEVQGASTADGGAVVQYDSWGGTNQQWQLVRVGTATSPAPTPSPSASASAPTATGSLPSSFRWSSSGVLAGPKPDASHPAVAVKDFSVIRYQDKWHVYATTASSKGWGLVHYAFSDWSQASSATHTYLDRSGIGAGYRAAPQVFYFAPQDLWYMVYQTGPPTYSTTKNPADPLSWSAPKKLIANEPAIVSQNKGNGTWIDFWNICDAQNCYLFFSDDNGHTYRAQTALANFPNGFGNVQIVMTDKPNNNFEGANVYKVAGKNQYLMVVEAIGSTGRRYFRSWTATSLTGAWTPLAATESNPFAGRANVTFPEGTWTQDISHGELVRSGNDQTLPISPCRLQYVYQGQSPSASGDYLLLPWRMGLLTQTNSTC